MIENRLGSEHLESVIEKLLRLNRYIPHTPTPKQAAFLLLPHHEILYGGAAGGGKSDALLMSALQYVDVAGYSALILRRSYSDLVLPSGLMDRAREWLSPTDATWIDREKTWRFPSGATLTFGYLDTSNDKYRYQSSEFQYIAFDELTQFDESDYLYLFSRLRRLRDCNVPIRMRSATNPGGRGHEWVKRRFIDARAPGRLFIRATLADNPHLDRAEYEHALSYLPLVERERLLHGDWDIRPAGNLFRREWFPVAEAEIELAGRAVRAWDLASTAQSAKASDPDWCVGLKLVQSGEQFIIADVQRFRATPEQTFQRIIQTARLDTNAVPILIEQEAGSAGKIIVSALQRELPGFSIRALPVRGDKTARASLVSAAAERGRVALARGMWVEPFLAELEWFPESGHDDQVDALTLGFNYLSRGIIQAWAY